MARSERPEPFWRALVSCEGAMSGRSRRRVDARSSPRWSSNNAKSAPARPLWFSRALLSVAGSRLAMAERKPKSRTTTFNRESSRSVRRAITSLVKRSAMVSCSRALLFSSSNRYTIKSAPINRLTRATNATMAVTRRPRNPMRLAKRPIKAPESVSEGDPEGHHAVAPGLAQWGSMLRKRLHMVVNIAAQLDNAWLVKYNRGLRLARVEFKIKGLCRREGIHMVLSVVPVREVYFGTGGYDQHVGVKHAIFLNHFCLNGGRAAAILREYQRTCYRARAVGDLNSYR